MPKPGFNNRLAKFYFICFLLIILNKALFSQQALVSPYGNHYYFLSQSFFKGRLDVTEQIRANFATPSELKKAFDYAIFKGKYFVPMGGFPAAIGIPFLILGPESHLVALTAFFLILTAYFLTKFVRYFLKKEAFLTALLLIIASPLLTTLVFKGPWYLTGLISACLGLWFLWLHNVKKKEWGALLIIPLVLTRPTTIFYFLIPFVDILKKGKRKILILSASVALALALFFAYNWLRFGDILEAGYRYQAVPTTEFRKTRYQEEASIKDYFLSNAIYMFINPPRVHLNKGLRFTFPYFELSRYGVGLIFTIPWFLPYFFSHPRKRRDWPYLLTMGAILLAVLSFPGEGSFQIGSRYACDFLPLIVFLNLKWLAQKKEKIPLFQKLLLSSFVFNTYFYLLVLLGHIRKV